MYCACASHFFAFPLESGKFYGSDAMIVFGCQPLLIVCCMGLSSHFFVAFWQYEINVAFFLICVLHGIE